MTIFPLVVRLQSVRSDDIREDGTVQWEKFQRFEEILRIIPECQARGSMVPGSPSSTFISVFDDIPIIDDEDVSLVPVDFETQC